MIRVEIEKACSEYYVAIDIGEVLTKAVLPISVCIKE